jgi:glycosyltransferase involved in cell wall biosynthesis
MPEQGELVSVIIPAFNAERYIEATLQSAVRQTYQPMEIIVIDDGSTDATVDKITAFSERVTLLRQENAGVYAARNVAAERSKGEYLAFLDADDLWEPAKLERQVEVFRHHPEVAVVAVGYDEIDHRGDPLERGLRRPRCAVDQPVGLYQELLTRGNFLSLSSCMVRRAAFIELGGFYARERILSADYDFWIRLSERCPFYLISETLCHYRILEHSLLHGSLSKEYGAQLNILRMNRDRFSTLGYRARMSRLYRDWADSALFEGQRDGWRMWRAALHMNPFNIGAWVLGARVMAGRVVHRGRVGRAT